MEKHHFQWVNPLFLWPFSIAMLVITRGYMGEVLFWGMQRLRQVAGMMIPQVLFSVINGAPVERDQSETGSGDAKIPMTPFIETGSETGSKIPRCPLET